MDTRQTDILLIEDNPEDALLLETYLGDAWSGNYRLKHVTHLVAGLEELRQGDFDVVLLDLGLPDTMPGLEGFNRTYALVPQVPIIVLTGYDNDDLATAAVQKGAQDYLVKGQVSDVLLVRSIRYSIERQKLRTALQESAKEIRTLRSFLPICASCKKIREDSGYWTQIETYIRAHTGTEFSHGICPECALKLYGKKIGEKARF